MQTRGDMLTMFFLMLQLVTDGCGSTSGSGSSGSSTSGGSRAAMARAPSQGSPVPAGSGSANLCPLACQCQEDGILLIVDCSELGLSSVPANFSPLTSYL